jgi:TM2 domain-containing membrane protein YozV
MGLARWLGLGWLGLGRMLGLRVGLGMGLEPVLGLAAVLLQPVVGRQCDHLRPLDG